MNMPNPENPGDLATALREAMANYEAQWQSENESLGPDDTENCSITESQMNESMGYVLAWLWAASHDSINRIAIKPINDSRSELWCDDIHDLYITGVARHTPPATTGGTSSEDIIKGFTIMSDKMTAAFSNRTASAEDNRKGKGFSALGDIEGRMLLRASSRYSMDEPDEEGNDRTGLVREKPVDSCIKILEASTHANAHTILRQRVAESYGCNATIPLALVIAIRAGDLRASVGTPSQSAGPFSVFVCGPETQLAGVSVTMDTGKWESIEHQMAMTSTAGLSQSQINKITKQTFSLPSDLPSLLIFNKNFGKVLECVFGHGADVLAFFPHMTKELNCD